MPILSVVVLRLITVQFLLRRYCFDSHSLPSLMANGWAYQYGHNRYFHITSMLMLSLVTDTCMVLFPNSHILLLYTLIILFALGLLCCPSLSCFYVGFLHSDRKNDHYVLHYLLLFDLTADVTFVCSVCAPPDVSLLFKHPTKLS